MKIENSNFVFFGTPEVASGTLKILKKAGFLPSLIVTSPDKPQGRKMLVTPPPVKVWAEKNNIPYIQPEKITEEEMDIAFRTLSQDGEPRRAIFQQENMRGEKSNMHFFLVVAYGKIIPESILNMPKLGSINIHYSLLPKYRGASPVESAILNGETETGVTIQQMKYEMDAGDILAQEKVEIITTELTTELRRRLIKIGGDLLVKTLPDLVEGKIKAVSQNETEATFCKKIKKEDGLVDLEKESPATLYNKFRAYATWPRIFFLARRSLGEGGFQTKRIIITDAVLENGKFVIKRVIPEGGKETDWKN
ncbi:methionyl-tRNA formyltransferase [Candidatus Nomurabacteria bacterium RIFCSPHIGHO2_02_FULL_42_19]|uniref:Methionyl-tRNA formyltransferase n=1 Tax=Candidatus Nomurabacteria bacterium RIFCSPHIGHO2_02_FULL_42_19 TaxID=1801756 RepID=A0A1F6W2L7_9BACT|nr:MAG: methionyl-tRNA formyltransferase [Candidatus Nomurabacteria bacterium RIFCSPHIGHO2_02_FULL_42_19]